MFKDAVPLSQNDEFYLVTDTEGNTDTELLQKKFNTEGNKFEHCVNKLLKNMAKISLIRYLEYYEPYTENMAKLSLARSPDKI